MKKNHGNNTGKLGEKHIIEKLKDYKLEVFSKGKEVQFPKPSNPSGKGRMDAVIKVNNKTLALEIKYGEIAGGTANDKWLAFPFTMETSKVHGGYKFDYAIMVIMGPCVNTDWAKHKLKHANMGAELLKNNDKVRIMFEEEFFKWLENEILSS